MQNLHEKILKSLQWGYMLKSSEHFATVREFRNRVRNSVLAMFFAPIATSVAVLASLGLDIDTNGRAVDNFQANVLIASAFPNKYRLENVDFDLMNRIEHDLYSMKIRFFIAALMSIIGVICLIICVVAISWPLFQKFQFDKLVRSKKIYPPQPEDIPFPWLEISERMGVSMPIRIWIKDSWECSAEVYEGKDAANIVLTEGLLSLEAQHPGFAVGIFVHELGHLIQKDGFLVKLDEEQIGRLSRVPRGLFIVIVIVTFFMSIIWGLVLWGVYSFLKSVPERAIERRREAELLADLASLAYVGPEFADALQLVLEDNAAQTSMTHPSKKDRVQTILGMWHNECRLVCQAEGYSYDEWKEDELKGLR